MQQTDAFSITLPAFRLIAGHVMFSNQIVIKSASAGVGLILNNVQELYMCSVEACSKLFKVGHKIGQLFRWAGLVVVKCFFTYRALVHTAIFRNLRYLRYSVEKPRNVWKFTCVNTTLVYTVPITVSIAAEE